MKKIFIGILLTVFHLNIYAQATKFPFDVSQATMDSLVRIDAAGKVKGAPINSFTENSLVSENTIYSRVGTFALAMAGATKNSNQNIAQYLFADNKNHLIYNLLESTLTETSLRTLFSIPTLTVQVRTASNFVTLNSYTNVLQSPYYQFFITKIS